MAPQVEPARAVRDSRLVAESSQGIALVSGGADSAALAAGLAAHCGAERVVGLHLNYGLRPDSGEDEATCRALAELLGIELVVERPRLGPGNVQAQARRARYDAAERLRRERGLDWVAAGHTRTDLAETVIYRLATSPGRRALLGLAPRNGAVVRPLLDLARHQVRGAAKAAGLPFRDDPSNAEPAFARNRIRNEVLPVLREIGPSAEEVIAETQLELREEAAVLERAASEALGPAAGAAAVPVSLIAELDPALARIALRQLAERAAGGQVPLGRARAEEIRRVAASREGGVVELGSGIEARVEHGFLSFSSGSAEAPPADQRLSIPGSCRFGGWELTAELREGEVQASGPELALLDPGLIGEQVVVRAWRDGDRISPLGLDGTKTLQDLFTDHKVPRSLRRTLPLVVSGGEIAWVAGVAVSEQLRARPGAERTAVLSARAAE
ncbi:MAG: tRNA lysidine(34) synthetase TilS [Solirubrobacterales bacterium]|nr:tRNA lysidine(34) synthetase TilS [Solirubrobacterales bacterium]